MVKEEDFYEAMMEYLTRCAAPLSMDISTESRTGLLARDCAQSQRMGGCRAHADNIVRAEINFEPQSHTERGISFETCFKGYYRAIQARHWPQRELQTASSILRY